MKFATYDFILYSGSDCSVVGYIRHKKGDFRWLNYYLEQLVIKRWKGEHFTKRDYTVLFSLLYNGAQPMSDCRIDKYQTILDLALQTNDRKLLKLLLPFLKYIDDPFDYDYLHQEDVHLARNPLLAAVAFQSLALVQLAVEGYFHLQNELSYMINDTPLHIAATLPNVDITRYLLENCSGYNEAKNIFLETPLFLAIKHGQIEQAKILLQYGSDYKVRNIDGYDVFHFLCLQDDVINVKMLKFIIDIGYDPNSVDDSGWAPLHLVAKNQLVPNALEAAELFIRRGADVNKKTGCGKSVVYLASKYCNEFTPLLKLLLKSGIDRNIVDFGNRTFLEVLFLDGGVSRRQNMLKNLVLLDYIGDFRNDSNLTISSEWSDLFFEMDCINELHLLDSYRVAEYGNEPEYSFVRILNSNKTQIAQLCKDPDLPSIMFVVYKLNLPIYGCDLRIKIDSGFRLFMLEKWVFEFLTVVSHGMLNYYVMKDIFKHILAKK